MPSPSRFTPITTQETLDPDVFATKTSGTRPGYSQAETKRVETRDMADVESLQRTIQGLTDDVALLGRVVSSLPFFGGIFLAAVKLVGNEDKTIQHGINWYVSIFATVPIRVAGGSPTFEVVSQDPETKTIVIRSNRDCQVSLLIFPQQRGK